MRTSTAIMFSLLLGASTFACDKGGEKKADDKKADGKGDDKKADEAKADGGEAKAEADKPAGPGPVDLPKVGLKGDAPAGTNVSDMMGSDMVQGPGLVATVEKGEGKPATPEAAQEDAEMYGPKDPKIEKLDDGFVLTFTNEGSAGTNYWVNVRREIDGAAYWCSTTGSSQADSDAAVAFCKSLRK